MPRTLRRRGLRSLAEAKRAYADLVVELEEKLRATVIPNWSTALDRFAAYCRSRELTEKTIANYLVNLRAYTESQWAARPVNSFTRDEIRDFVVGSTQGRSASQRQNLLKFIRSVFTMCVEKGFIKHNPSPTMRFRKGDKIRRVLNEDQVRLFLNQARMMNAEWFPHWATALYTGMRNGELYALTWDKVDLINCTIVVSEAWNSKDGFKSTKSGNDRVIGIAPPLRSILQELKLTDHDPAFVLPRLSKWDKGEQARELRMFLQGMGIPPVRFHDLRATWATLLLCKGVEPIRVMKMGGWEDIKTMMIYTRKAGVDIRGVSDVLNLHDSGASYGSLLDLRPASL
jgi:integrase